MSDHATRQLRLWVLTVTAAALLAIPGSAHAGTYTVVSCNSAQAFGFNASAWERYSNTGNAYETCPTGGGFTAGVSNRMTERRYDGFNFSGHAFNAPPGTTIRAIRWAGRIARANCTWGTFMRAMPSGATVLGLRNGQYCGDDGSNLSNYPITFPAPAGTTRLEQLVICGATKCDPGAAMHSHTLEVTIDDPQPPSISLGGRMVSGQWVSGRAPNPPSLEATASDASGVQRLETTLGTQRDEQPHGCNWSVPQPCPGQVGLSSIPSVAQLADGRHTFRISAIDAAGNSNTATRDVYVDNTPLDPVVPEVVGGSGWRRTNEFRVVWTDPPNTAAPITRVHWKLCLTDGSCPVGGDRLLGSTRELPDVHLPAPGEYHLRLWLEDAAGNQREANSALSVPARFDPLPPDLSFALPDSADPLRVAVNATDQLSGLANGEIEMRTAGSNTWHGLPTARQGSQFVAYVDDERFRNGLYEFRAHARDQAGNEASTGTRTDGAAASLRLPARITTRLRVGVRQSRGLGKGLTSNVAAPFGRRIRLSGRLTNDDGQPIDGASIDALERRPDGTVSTIGLATSDRGGRFAYVLGATRNREVLFRYGGSRRIGSANALVRLRVGGTTSIDSSRKRLRNGQSVVFTGRVVTRPIPPSGKLLEMQAYFRGRWRTFSTIRTSPTGRWRFRYRFGATLGRVNYRFRVRVPTEGGYPFSTGTSKVVRVVVLGP